MTVGNHYMQKRGRAKCIPEITLVVTACHCHHHLPQNINPKPAHQREADGIAEGNQGPQPPGLDRVTRTQEVDPDLHLDPGTEVETTEENTVVVKMLSPGAAQDQEIGQNIVKIAKHILIDQVKLNTPTDECHMTIIIIMFFFNTQYT